MRWNDTKTTTNEEWYLYDASAQRVLRRSQTGPGRINWQAHTFESSLQFPSHTVLCLRPLGGTADRPVS